MTSDEHAARRIDVTRLPEDVVELIDALGPGDELVVTRDGDVIATVSSTCGPVIEPVAEATDEPDYDNVTVVATAMKLPAAARTSLSTELGPDYIVLDMNSAPATADVLLVPPVSPQLIRQLGARFPRARIVVTEIEDPALGVSFRGPISRLLDAGAEGYLASTAIPQLARQLDHTITQRQITGDVTVPREIEPPTE